MKCNILLKEAIDGSIVSPEERADLNTAKPKDKAIVDNKLQEAANGMQKKKEES